MEDDPKTRQDNQLWSDKSRILYQNNAPAHNVISVKWFLAKKQIKPLCHLPYSPDLELRGFWIFLKLKTKMKRTHFLSLKELKASVMKELKRLKERKRFKISPSAFVGGRTACKSALTHRECTLHGTIHKLAKYVV